MNESDSSRSAGQLVPDWLRQRALGQPHQAAVLCEGCVLSFAELDRRATRAAGQLRRLGVQPGERVAAVIGNRIGFLELLHGATRLGAVLVPLSPRLTARELELRVADCDARLLAYERDTASRVRGATRRVCIDTDPLPGDPLWREVEALALDAKPMIDLAAPHTILYTSGSTGNPKGVCLTAGNHFWNAAGSAFNLGVHAEDRWLACLAFAHVGGLAILLRGVIYGMTVVVQERFDPGEVNRSIDEERVTIVSLVASMLDRVLRARGDRPYPPWLRCVLLGGGPAPRSLLAECAARRVPVVQTYGMTETASQVTTLAPADALAKLGSAGRPLLTTEVRLRNECREAAPGEVGEILVRGPTVASGYTRSPSVRLDADAWFATGDLGRVDDEGFLYVVGRLDDRIISGGENVEPGEVEIVLEAHPAIAEACVFGIPDEHWGEIVVACVRPEPGLDVDAEEIQTHARRSLAGFKIPRRIILCQDFPRSATGKLLRGRVRADVCGDV